MDIDSEDVIVHEPCPLDNSWRSYEYKYLEANLMTGLARSARSDNEALQPITLDLDPCPKSVEGIATITLNTVCTSYNTRAEEQSRDSE